MLVEILSYFYFKKIKFKKIRAFLEIFETDFFQKKI